MRDIPLLGFSPLRIVVNILCEYFVLELIANCIANFSAMYDILRLFMFFVCKCLYLIAPLPYTVNEINVLQFASNICIVM